MTSSLRARSGWKVFDGFGRAIRSASRFETPANPTELSALFTRANDEHLRLAFRGSGRSYGDAALNTDGAIVDITSWNRILAWDAATGIIEVEPGVTIEDLWRRVLPDGYWPHVVPGTMRPTLGGCLATNVHGKNNFKAGPFGDHVLDFDLLTPKGELLRCSRDENSALFYGAIGGLGLLGAFTRVRLQLKKVETGLVRVDPIATKNLDGTFDAFEKHLPESDYLVGWVDCVSSGSSLGRGQLHRANYVSAAEDPTHGQSLALANQDLPSTILGFPKSLIWRFMQPFMNNLGVGLVNYAKYIASVLGDRKTYFQSHVAFAFLLDYVPNWRLAYGDEGFIQHQLFIPKEGARETLRRVLALCQERGLPSYLGVLKRHRTDDFLLSHSVDGWSFAMDFKVTKSNREALWQLTRETADIVLDAGGRFYFAKDAILRADQVERSFGKARLDAFFALKNATDPNRVLESDLMRRVFPRPEANVKIAS